LVVDSKGIAVATVDRICSLIGHHEIGGSPDQDLLMDLDNLSFFENNVTYFLDFHLKQFGVARVSEKFNWMYTRITNDKIIALVQ